MTYTTIPVYWPEAFGKDQEKPVFINEEDFNARIHTHWADKVAKDGAAKAEKPAERASKAGK